MNRLVAITGMALLTAGLIGWVAFAAAQPHSGQPTSGSELSAESGGAEPGAEGSPAGEPTISPRVSGPSGSLIGASPMPSAPAATLPPMMSGAAPAMSGLAPLPPSSPASKAPAALPITPLPMQQPAGAAPLGQLPGRPAVSSVPAHPLASGLAPVPMEGPSPAAGANPTAVGAGQSPLTSPQNGTVLPPLGSNAPTSLPENPVGAAPANEEPHSTDLAMTPDNGGNRQEPSVSLEWVGPAAAKVSQPNGYNLVVRNTCAIPVQQVLVRVRIPSGLTCAETEPKAVAEGNVLVWELGALQAKEEKVLQMKLQAEQKGDVSPQAWVTFTGSSVMHIKIREPKLTLQVQGPQKILLGETAAFQLAVSNPGDGSADHVKIRAVLSDGLECPRGNKVDFDIGNLAAGETRTVTVMSMTKLGGVQKCDVSAEAEAGLRARETAQVNVTMPRLELQVAGPGLRYLGRKALYSLKVSNPGDATATNVTVSDLVPEGFKVLAASDGGRHDFSAHTVSWFLGELKPGETHEVKLEVQAANPGEFQQKASAVGAHNLCAESELTTRVEGLSALMLEMVDTDDPIEVNSETSYEVRITNTGSKVETDIKLVATIPDKMEFKSATGPARFHEEGKTIIFEPLEKLAPKADAVFRLNVKALDQGTVRFKIQMTSTNLTEPVIKMEATRIYSDAPETKSSH